MQDAITCLAGLGLAIQHEGDGLRVSGGLELLREQTIRAAMGEYSALLKSLDLPLVVDSTNTRLLASAQAGATGVAACIAEAQSGGRGRRGRDWRSPLGRNLYLSLLHTSPTGTIAPGQFSLAAGAAVARAIASTGAKGIGLKWPNDLLWQGRKLGGLLLEYQVRDNRGLLVIGVGINISSAPPAPNGDALPAVSLDEVMAGGRLASRNVLAGRILAELISMLALPADRGPHDWRRQWREFDCVIGHPVRILPGRGEAFDGIATGIDEHGALLLDTITGPRTVHSGEVSLRLRD